MKLKDFLAGLTSTNIQVTLTDLNSGNEIVTFKASGYASLDDTIEDREVKQWSIASVTTIKVVLGDVVTTEP